MGWAELKKAIANDNSNTENWSDETSAVEVTQRKGFMCNIKAKGRLRMEPERVFDILVAPDNYKYFSGIKKIEYRKVLEDDGNGKMKVEVQQVGQWKFLGFSGQFATKLHVHQDKKAGTISFRLAKPGLMKDFAGDWTIQPLTQKDLQSSKLPDPAKLPKGMSPNFMGVLPFNKAKGTLVTLEQSILPGFIPPKPLDRVLKGISSKQVQIILQDLKQEVDRQLSNSDPDLIKAGRPNAESGTHEDNPKKDRRCAPPPAFG